MVFCGVLVLAGVLGSLSMMPRLCAQPGVFGVRAARSAVCSRGVSGRSGLPLQQRQHSRRLQRQQLSAPPRRLNTALRAALRPVIAILLARGFARRADASASLVADTVSDLNCAAPVARRRRRATNTFPVLARHHTCRESKETVIHEPHEPRRRAPHSPQPNKHRHYTRKNTTKKNAAPPHRR